MFHNFEFLTQIYCILNTNSSRKNHPSIRLKIYVYPTVNSPFRGNKYKKSLRNNFMLPIIVAHLTLIVAQYILEPCDCHNIELHLPFCYSDIYLYIFESNSTNMHSVDVICRIEKFPDEVYS